MKKLMHKCTIEDFDYLANQLRTYNPIVKDSDRIEILEKYKQDPSVEVRIELIDVIYSDLEYFASADFAYLYRKIFKDDVGIPDDELVTDVASKLKVKINPSDSIESKLKEIVKSVVVKEFFSKDPEKLAEILRKMEIGENHIIFILEEMEKLGRAAIIPILIQIIGPKLTIKVIETIIVAAIGQIIGQKSAAVLFKEIIKRNPYLVALGSITWIIFGTWLAYDLQGPAYRITIPVCLYLGVVALRDDLEDKTMFLVK